MTARAARLEQGVLVTLKMTAFSGLRGVQGSRHGAAVTVATLPLEKGPKDCVRGEAW